MINTVTLCGSTRFAADFAECNRELTKRGISVITISFAAEKDVDGVEKEQGVKELLDLVHLNKILRSDAIVIVGDGYIGFNTAREILWADMQGKYIYFSRLGSRIDAVGLCISFRNPETSNENAHWKKMALAKLRELDAAK